MKVSHCRICGNSRNNKEFYAKEMMFGVEDIFRYFQCSSCECLQIEDFPEDMTKYYPQNYYSSSPINLVYKNHRNLKLLKQLLRTKRNEAVLLNGDLIGKVLSKIFPLDKNGIENNSKIEFNQLKRMGISFRSKILDVGCGTGEVLRYLNRIGFKNLYGIDPFVREDITYPEGVKVWKKSICDIHMNFDLIMFHHSFEHMSDPLEVLRAVNRNLSGHGLCVIRIPVVTSYAWEKYGIKWVQVDAPRHFYLHSIKSMELLVNKANLKIDDIIWDSTSFQLWGSEQYLKGIPLRSELSYAENKSKSIFSPYEIKLFETQANELNRNKCGDQAAFFISKIKN
jgi:2-polyprenyl-3-methyl-5-hydroxy-6-metoxy-1,4-benzoquinol methylase